MEKSYDQLRASELCKHGNLPSTCEVCRVEGEPRGKHVLHELEKTGEYVFHGSQFGDITELETRQPYDYPEGKKVPHGNPSVVGTPFADIAIFRALVYTDSTSFGSNEGQLNFGASTIALEDAKEKRGYVYVLPRKAFVPMHGDENEMDWRAEATQKPLQVIEVRFEDLPEGIQSIKSRKPNRDS